MPDDAIAIDTLDAAGRHALDVSRLPTSVPGPRSPVWWGNTLLMFTESMTLLLLVASYFYVRQNFAQWPPPNPNSEPPIFRPVPDLLVPTLQLVVMLASCGLMSWTDRAAEALGARRTKIGLWLMFAIVLVMIAGHFKNFEGTHVRFNDNAYASLVWTMLGLHLTYLLVAAGEMLIMVLWIHRAQLDEHHAHDVVLTGIYWYWVVGTWALLYAVVYVGARVL